MSNIVSGCPAKANTHCGQLWGHDTFRDNQTLVKSIAYSRSVVSPAALACEPEGEMDDYYSRREYSIGSARVFIAPARVGNFRAANWNF